MKRIAVLLCGIAILVSACTSYPEQDVLVSLRLFGRLSDGRAEWPREITFSPDGKLLASISGSNVDLWDVSGERKLHTLVSHTGAVTSITFSPDGSTLVSASEDRTIILWDVTNGRQWQVLITDGSITQVVISPDGQTLAVGAYDEFGTYITLWDIKDIKNARTLRILEHSQGDADDYYIRSLAFSPDGTLIASGFPTGAKVWNVKTGHALDFFPVAPMCFGDGCGYKMGIEKVVFSPDNVTVLLFDRAGDRMIQWNMENGGTTKILDAPAGSYFRDVTFLPDGRQFAAVFGEEDFHGEDIQPARSYIYDAQTFQRIGYLEVEGDLCFATAPDGGWLVAVAERGMISIWDLAP